MLVALDKDRKVIRKGDQIVSFRNENWNFVSIVGPSKLLAKDSKGQKRELYPSVFGLTIEWLETQDHKEDE